MLENIPENSINRFKNVAAKELEVSPAALVDDDAAVTDKINALFISQCSEAGGWLTAASECAPMRCKPLLNLENGVLISGTF